MKGRSGLTALAFVSLTLTLAACGPDPLPGTPVNSLSDTGTGSLREAIAAASAGDTLRMAQSGTVTLSSPLTVSKNLTILADGVTFDAAGLGRVLEVASGVTVSVKGGTLKGGVGQVLASSLNTLNVVGRFGPASLDDVSEGKLSAAGLGAQADPVPTAGGVILNTGTLTLDGVTVTGGKANVGGGIYNAAGATLNLNGSTSVTGNAAQALAGASSSVDHGIGGGIFNKGTLNIAGGKVDNNTAPYSGAGVYNGAGATLTLSSGSVDSNTATEPVTTTNGVTGGSAGGGIFSYGDVTISGGSVSGNTVAYFGGGITVQAYLDAQNQTVVPKLTISGGSFQNNKATDTAAGGSGGAVWTSGTLTVTGGEFKGNSAPYGGGISMFRDASITGGTVMNNTATYNGGGLLAFTPASRASAATLTFGSTAVVSGNTAGDSSGGIAVSRSTLNMTGGTVSGNTSVNGGGGMFLGGNTVSTISGGVVSGNKTTGTVDGGGGARVGGGSKLTLSGGEISGNITQRTGGGITVGGELVMTGGSVSGNSVFGTTSAENSAHQGGGGIRLYAGAKATVSGGTIQGNKARWGAGVVIDGPFQTSAASEFTLSGGTVSGNTVTDASNNGGGFFNGGKLTITAGSVTGNTATRNGGGVFNQKVATYAQPGGSVTGNTPDNVFTAP